MITRLEIRKVIKDAVEAHDSPENQEYGLSVEDLIEAGLLILLNSKNIETDES